MATKKTQTKKVRDAKKATVGNLIAEARIKAGMTQADIEQESGISKSRLSSYEHGRFVPTIASIELIAKALGVSPKKLVGWK